MNRVVIEDTRKILYDPILHRDLDTFVKQELTQNLEGICNEIGLVIPGSIRIQKRSIPALNTLDIGGMMFVMVSYTAEVIEIVQGAILDVVVKKINKMGIQGEVNCWCSGEQSDVQLPIATILLPVELAVSTEQQERFANIKEEDTISVKILGSRFHSGDSVIVCVGVLNDE
jgi:DNA-directed RNA polymerase subunit E'/Rpb7